LLPNCFKKVAYQFSQFSKLIIEIIYMKNSFEYTNFQTVIRGIFSFFFPSSM